MAKRTFDDENFLREPGPKPGPLPESVSFGMRRRSVHVFVVPGVILIAAAFLVPGENIIYLRGLLALIGLLCLRAAGMRWLFRVRMNPDGILVTGARGIPWAAIHDVRILSVANPRRKGIEFQYTGPEGQEGVVRVPGDLEGGVEVFRAFLTMTERHGSPWSPTRDFQEALKNAQIC
ncbi:MAG: hypothetical protein ABFS86_17555 [Planctomycetota bacterium]